MALEDKHIVSRPDMGKMPMLQHKRRGSIYLLILGIAAILTVIGLGAVSVSRVNMRSAGQSQDWSEAQALAFSAVEHALAKINADSNWRATFNGQTITKSLGRGTFAWQLTDETGNSLSNSPTAPFLIHATGTVGRATYSTNVHCTIPQTSAPYGLMATGSISLVSGASIDSFDSSLGNYGGANVGSNATVATNTTAAGGVTVSESTIKGSVSVGSGGNPSTVISGSANITGTKSALSQTLTMPMPTVTVPSGIGASTGNLTYNSGTVTLTDTTLHVNNLNIATAARVKISGPCVIVADGTVTIQNNGSGFEILPGATLSVYHTGQLQIKAGASNIVDGSDMSRLQFLNAGTSQVVLQDITSTQGMIISPNASVMMKSGFQLYGAIQAQSITMQNNSTSLHQDLHISGTGGSGGAPVKPVPGSWTRIMH